jgi:hypothetical protein
MKGFMGLVFQERDFATIPCGQVGGAGNEWPQKYANLILKKF